MTLFPRCCSMGTHDDKSLHSLGEGPSGPRLPPSTLLVLSVRPASESSHGRRKRRGRGLMIEEQESARATGISATPFADSLDDALGMIVNGDFGEK